MAEFQKHINDTGYDVANQKYCFFAGMQWELSMLLVQHDTDLLTFDEMVKLSTSLASRAQLVNQNRPKIYFTPLFNNIYVSFLASTTMNTTPTQHQVATTYTNLPVKDLGQNGQESGFSGLSSLSKLFVDIYDLSKYTKRNTKSEKK